MYLAKMGIPFTAYCVGQAGHPDVKISKIIAKKWAGITDTYSYQIIWDHDQINWIEQAVQRGDGQLNVVQLAKDFTNVIRKSLLLILYM